MTKDTDEQPRGREAGGIAAFIPLPSCRKTHPTFSEAENLLVSSSPCDKAIYNKTLTCMLLPLVPGTELLEHLEIPK